MSTPVQIISTRSTLPQFFNSVAYSCIISSSLAATLVSIWKLYAQDKYARSLESRESITRAFLARYSSVLTILGSYYSGDRLSRGVVRDQTEKGTPLLLDSLSSSLNNLSRAVHELPGATPVPSSSTSTILSQDVHQLSTDLAKSINTSKSEIMPAGRTAADQLPQHVESAVDLRTEIRSLKGLLLNRRNLTQSQ
ncbi:hypothetical protein E3P99_02131 [Wallemia hederae]|uniref:Peroxin-14 n=1 Tax=Wallemia hederae TaxID=1540922 RepID=A0A4T0FLV3_9BASI|nr:hypothetical protein E3P99_02131 [Wallemia hederae]